MSTPSEGRRTAGEGGRRIPKSVPLKHLPCEEWGRVSPSWPKSVPQLQCFRQTAGVRGRGRGPRGFLRPSAGIAVGEVEVYAIPVGMHMTSDGEVPTFPLKSHSGCGGLVGIALDLIWRYQVRIPAVQLCRHVISFGNCNYIAQVKSAVYINWTENDTNFFSPPFHPHSPLLPLHLHLSYPPLPLSSSP